jgi:AGCS family alanine or glycine:cation symporter
MPVNDSTLGFWQAESLGQWVAGLAGWVWGIPLLVLLVGTHLLLTVRLGVIQRYIPRAIRLSFSRSGDEAGVQGVVSQFGLLMTALAATIGTGNIIGSRE